LQTGKILQQKNDGKELLISGYLEKINQNQRTVGGESI
jgi:hypothetical protein